MSGQEFNPVIYPLFDGANILLKLNVDRCEIP